MDIRYYCCCCVIATILCIIVSLGLYLQYVHGCAVDFVIAILYTHGNQLSNALTRGRHLNLVTHRTGAVYIYNEIFFRKTFWISRLARIAPLATLLWSCCRSRWLDRWNVTMRLTSGTRKLYEVRSISLRSHSTRSEKLSWPDCRARHYVVIFLKDHINPKWELQTAGHLILSWECWTWKVFFPNIK